MRAALLIAAVVALWGCNRCAPGSCSGCCDAEGECLAGTTVAACGAGGAVCTECSASDFAQCVTGSCLLPALISAPDHVDFGTTTVNTEATVPITLTNSGGLSLVITQVRVDGQGFAVEPVPSAPIDPGASIVITFDFTPGNPGFFTGTASFTSNAGSHSSYLISLSGSGT